MEYTAFLHSLRGCMTSVPDQNRELIKNSLKDSYVKLSLDRLEVSQGFGDGDNCNVDIKLTDCQQITGTGVGLVDAIFNAFKTHYADEYESIKSIELIKFKVTAKSCGTEAEVVVEVDIKNSFGNVFYFSDSSRSLTASSARVSSAVVEYFINSEKAYVVLHSALLDAKERGRKDLVTRYTKELSKVVRSTSYACVIEKLKDSI